MSDIDTMEAGRELDALVAVEVREWQLMLVVDPLGEEFNNWVNARGVGEYRPEEWTPSTDIAAAWEVHQEMQGRLFSVRQRYYLEIQRVIQRRTHMHFPPAWPDVFGLVKAEDICRAAVEAVRAAKTTEAPAAEEIKRLQEALWALKRRECWCDPCYDPYDGHEDRCRQAREALGVKMTDAQHAPQTDGK